MKSIKEQAIELHEKGFSFGDIAKELNIGKSTAYAYVKEGRSIFIDKPTQSEELLKLKAEQEHIQEMKRLELRELELEQQGEAYKAKIRKEFEYEFENNKTYYRNQLQQELQKKIEHFEDELQEKDDYIQDLEIEIDNLKGELSLLPMIDDKLSESVIQFGKQIKQIISKKRRLKNDECEEIFNEISAYLENIELEMLNEKAKQTYYLINLAKSNIDVAYKLNNDTWGANISIGEFCDEVEEWLKS